jgi:predicted nucleic acid-binding Zn ribbon protein
MTGKLSERHAKQDRRIFAMMYFGITALILLAIVTLFI